MMSGDSSSEAKLMDEHTLSGACTLVPVRARAFSRDALGAPVARELK